MFELLHQNITTPIPKHRYVKCRNVVILTTLLEYVDEIPKGTFKDFDLLNTQFVSLVRTISSRVMRSELDELRRDTIMPTRPSVLSNNAVDVTFPWDKRFYDKEYVDFPFQRQSVKRFVEKISIRELLSSCC